MNLSKILYKSILSTLFFLIGTVTFFIVKFNQIGVSFDAFGYRIYTNSGFVLAISSVLFYACLRGIFVSLRIKHFIELRKIRYQYKQTLYKTKKQDISIEISKNLRNFGAKNFISIFIKDLRIENLPYYKLYTKNMSSFRKIITAKKIYNINPNNSTAAIIYSMALVSGGKYSMAKQLLCDFIENKSLQIQNARSMYIMSSIIIECEKNMSNNINFIKKYIDFIEHYDKNNN